MAYLEKGNTPVEVDRISGSRKVIDECINCYYHAFPCGQCEEGKEEVMTYTEFCQLARDGHELPERYEDFLADESHPCPESINFSRYEWFVSRFDRFRRLIGKI